MDFDYKTVLDSTAIPVLIAQPIYDKEHIVDFVVLFSNQAFASHVFKLEANTLFSSFRNRISQNVEWMRMGIETSTTGQISETTYYAGPYDTWFRLVMTRVEKEFVVVTLTDISTSVRYADRLKQSLLTDTLTALPNRIQFNKTFARTIIEAQKNKSQFALILFDLDNMKSLNDSKGQKEGDRILIKTAGIFAHFVKPDVNVFRFGDDEFLLLVTNIADPNYVTTISDTVLEAFGREGISISGGIAVFPDNTTESEDLIRFADLAMHAAKQNGKNRILSFTPEIYKTFLIQMLYKTKMPEAFRKKEFTLKYQPQFDITTNKLRGFEALLRWESEELGTISPDDFIAVAEETGFILQLGTWVIESVFETQKRWEEKYNFDGTISINVSPVQLKEKHFLSGIKALVEKYKVDPKNLEIEITEGVMIDNPDEIVKKLKQLRDMGFGLSLDDFGTGYSSLKYLQILPLTTLKIDKSFVQSITDDDGLAADITNAIIQMVNKMGLDTIAEGVEKSDQLMLLKLLKCKNVQGFLRGKPMSKESIEAYLAGDISAIDVIK